MTRRQEWLAHDLTDEQIANCQRFADKMQKQIPWTQEDTDRHADYNGYTCWLDLILDNARMDAEYQRGQYCAQMEE